MSILDIQSNILIVEDDQNVGDFIAAVLSSEGYGVVRAMNGRKAISVTADNNIDVVLLNLGLPDIDGIKVLKSIREWSEIPIIVVSSRVREMDKVEALDAGANDYITKPFGNNELLARIRAAIRIYKKTIIKKDDFYENFSVENLVIDYIRRKVIKNGQIIHLTPTEYKIVVLLSQNAGKVLTHEFIINRVWGGLYESDDQVLRVNIANIRRKLEDNPAAPKYIITVVGVGYRMVEPV